MDEVRARPARGLPDGDAFTQHRDLRGRKGLLVRVHLAATLQGGLMSRAGFEGIAPFTTAKANDSRVVSKMRSL